MKRFLKSFFTSFMIGIPFVIGLCAFMYIKSENQKAENIEETTISVKNLFEDTEVTFEDTSDTEILSQPETITCAADSVTLSFAGDVHFSELVTQNYDKNGISAVVDSEMLSFMKNADLLILNHEFVFSNRGEAWQINSTPCAMTRNT